MCMTIKRWLMLSISAMMLVILAACGNGQEEAEAPDDQESPADQEAPEEEAAPEEESEINVTLIDSEENEVGDATLTEGDEGVDISLNGENLPAGEHGFHIHDMGACEAPDFDSAGDHYNPTDANHGFDDPDGPHAGDMENIIVEDDGTIDVDITNDRVTLEEGAESTLQTDDGTSLIIHSEEDDYSSQPSGDAGDPIVCGVISEPSS